ncbi:cytochrome b (mitochondrion) [Diaphorina citri]|uniref:Cytochrome b n=4 Tax=Diaphorina citri TaxID=121845 RepID=A0A1X9QH03_DIACI|nr:cytochrome b [Diaphorina citri]ANC65511.1 cytochrome b [Diaphorina citri]AOW71075.1 cytochrome b [Diaphorina citri]ARQ27123.1 cytochrome b [Diaphorina citri]ARQ27136.1 cytochrome b [Diaphorina citri]ATD85662.1 cytochrome b [Diaphorina citri]
MLMMNSKIKSDTMIYPIYNSLINLPTPSNISILWNFGSLLGLMLMIQILSGLFLAMHFSANILIAFESVIHTCRDVNNGWMLRSIHSNGASFFFIFIYLHISRGIYFNSSQLKKTWMSGIIILFLTMGTAFLGYVLPWGQMSFWGATVITNLLSAIPYLGETMVIWLWGGFAVDNPTLTRFFTIHFLLPFILASLIMIHLMLLHESGSSNPLGTPKNNDKIPFHPYFITKDLLGYSMFLIMFLMLILYNPYLLNDPDNFIPANPLNTPLHIQPEWYFLFAYSILRAIPNKLGGVIALISSILILMLLMLFPPSFHKGFQFYPITQHLFWMWINIFILLTWIGMKPVEIPYVKISQMLTLSYFLVFILLPVSQQMWDNLFK